MQVDKIKELIEILAETRRAFVQTMEVAEQAVISFTKLFDELEKSNWGVSDE